MLNTENLTDLRVVWKDYLLFSVSSTQIIGDADLVPLDPAKDPDLGSTRASIIAFRFHPCSLLNPYVVCV